MKTDERKLYEDFKFDLFLGVLTFYFIIFFAVFVLQLINPNAAGTGSFVFTPYGVGVLLGTMLGIYLMFGVFSWIGRNGLRRVWNYVKSAWEGK